MVAVAQQSDLSGQPTLDRWKVMIVDDDHAVHQVTQLVLNGFEFEGKPLAFLHAYSGREARNLIELNPDTALILLDVVMESDQAGLQFVRAVREELRNHQVRIVLRTGEPGQAPEEKVIVDFDINGYKEKTELTAQRLFTTVYAALRSYRDITIIERNKRSLEKVIESSAYIFGHENSRDFASAVLEQIASLLRMENGVMFCSPGMGRCGDYVVTAATGQYVRYLSCNGNEQLPDDVRSLLEHALHSKANIYDGDRCVLHFADSRDEESLLYFGEVRDLSDWERRLVELFCANVTIALENVHLNTQLTETQREIVYLITDAVETRSQETGNHVKRVSKLASLLAIASGLGERTAALIELAAPLHDVGKIAIPDDILNKPCSHSEVERTLMKTHAEIGWKLLHRSQRPVIQLAARICRDHHENWDGSGYPSARSGEDISIEGRIVAVADVFDALGSRRCYKEPWPANQIRQYFVEQSGKKFDPGIVQLLLEHWAQALQLRIEYPDEHDTTALPRSSRKPGRDSRDD